MLTHHRPKETIVSKLRRPGLIVSLIALLLALTNIAFAATPVKVLGTPRNEIDPSAEGEYLAYGLGRAGAPNKFDAYLKPTGAPRIKVNAAGTQGYHPNLELGNLSFGDALVFVQRNANGADIKIWDVDSGGRSNPPAGVNTSAGESKPSLDGNHLLFGRGPAKQFYMTRVILFDLTLETTTVLDTAPRNGIVYPGIVNGDWATWTECSPTDCRAWRYEISTESKTEVPSSARLIYTSAIGVDGTVWFVQSGIGCGANVKIRRAPIGSASTWVDFPPGIDANISDLDDSGPARQVYFSRVVCSNVRNWNLYRVAAD